MLAGYAFLDTKKIPPSPKKNQKKGIQQEISDKKEERKNLR